MSSAEWLRLNPGVDITGSAKLECGDIFVTNSMVEENRAARIFTQFAWGCRMEPAFRHSSDNSSRVLCTLGKLAK